MIDPGRGLEYGLVAANVCYRLMRFVEGRGGRVALRPAAQLSDLVPGIHEGLRSMTFVERAVTSSRTRAGWVSL